MKFCIVSLIIICDSSFRGNQLCENAILNITLKFHIALLLHLTPEVEVLEVRQSKRCCQGVGGRVQVEAIVAEIYRCKTRE